MDDYAGRVLADRYRLPLPPSDEYELTESRAFDTYSGQEVLVRQVPLPEVVEAEVLDADGLPDGFTVRGGGAHGFPGHPGPSARPGPRRPADPVVRRAVEAAQAAAGVPDHPRLDQVFDVFADGGSLWIVSELVPARSLATLLAEKPLTPYRAAEIAADILMALRVLHGHGWVHRNLTARTVLVCDDGRVMLTGLAAGAAEEALCGYDPVPHDPEDDIAGGMAAQPPRPAGTTAAALDPEAERRAAIEARSARGLPAAGVEAAGAAGAGPAGLDRRPLDPTAEIRAARAGAIAAYRAGARAAARVQEAQNGRTPGPGARPADGAPGPDGATTAPDATAFGGTSAFDSGRPPLHGPVPPGGAAPFLPSRQAGGTLPVPSGSPAVPAGAGVPTGWDGPTAGGPGPRRGPATALAAERARQARMAVVGPVTERWAPEQAGPVHENWQLAAPIGPATDLWALGALLFRAVQGHAPYPEESTAELVQMVCAEPPAFAEECGPLRPVVESLLRQDPTERIDFEELGGWLRSLVRSAPEPDAGVHVVAAPPADTGRLPIVRRRGELVRRRRAGLPAHHGRHKKAGQEEESPRRLGRTLLVLVLLGLGAAIAYAVMFMPTTGTGDGDGSGRSGSAGEAGQAPGLSPDASGGPGSGQTATGPDDGPSDGSAETQTTVGPDVADGFTLRKDPEGFRVAVAEGWQRSGRNGRGQVVYAHGDFELIVVPGRDGSRAYGSDPMAYQREHERELQPFRDSTWATSTGLKTIEVGGRTMAEGQFTWTGDDGCELFVRNLAMLVDGHYHVVQVRGPEAERDEVTRLFEQASATYQVTG
ncbi:protein kinase [Streptomyces sp. NPDC005925]|uniref:protein kinase domain-containing protein n=1 Tax=Streptomyces sp. NPDC005925 TaxID=3157172 RepID=UPI0033DA92A0